MTRLSRRLQGLYDDYRTACLSKKYYSDKLARFKKLNLYADIVLAAAASSTFASSQVFREHALFHFLAPWAAGAVALLAVIKPLLGFEREIERLSKLVTHYAEIFEQTRRLVDGIYVDQTMTEAQEWQASNLQNSLIKFASAEDLIPCRKKLARLEAEVREELPSKAFWYPADEPMPPTAECNVDVKAPAVTSLVAING